MKVLVDMNLSPEWVPFLSSRGYEATHWSQVGSGDATDAAIMKWARDHGHVVFTHDLDFGILLAHSRDGGPSVVQARNQEVAPPDLGPLLLRVLQAHREILEDGALVTVDSTRSRVRILPIARRE